MEVKTRRNKQAINAEKERVSKWDGAIEYYIMQETKTEYICLKYAKRWKSNQNLM